MMKSKLFLTCALAAASLSMSAQDLRGTKLDDRIGHGQDSLEVRQNLSLYMDYFKQKQWADAVEPWEFVFNKAPLAMIRVYTDGSWMFEQLIKQEQDQAKKNEYFDKLMKIYDTRLANLDALNSFATPKTTSTKGNILCRKGWDYYYYCPNMEMEKAYSMFRSGIDDMGPNTEAFVLYGFIDCSYRRYMNDKENTQKRTDFIRDYMECNDICDQLLEQAKEFAETDTIKAQKIVDQYQPTQVQCNDLFVQSGAADCDALEKIYSAGVEANKNDINYLNSVLQVLVNFDCDKSNIYYVASDYAYQLHKTPQAAIGKAQRLLKDGKETEALKYFQEAVDLEDNVAKKAKYSYIIAALFYKKGNISACRTWCNKTLSYEPSKGDAYLLIASCVARCASGDNLERSKYFNLAYDKAMRAKAVDPACAGKANRAASNYASHFYPRSEAFFAGIKEGQRVSVMGETTTLRLR